MTPRMGRALESFKHRISKHITEKHTKKQEYGSWEYPSLETAMEKAGFEEIGAYVMKRQNTVAQYIATGPNSARRQCRGMERGFL